MSRSKESFGKKEVRNKQAKKRKDKEKRRLEKKDQGKKSLDDMIAYVDENGNIVDTPPDETQKEEIDPSTIEVGVPKKEHIEVDPIRKGKVVNFDSSKGYGFIIDAESGDSVFVHVNDCVDRIDDGAKVQFETERSPKGLKAVNVTLQ